MLNALTIDLEDYFQVVAFGKGSEDWDSHESRVQANTHRILDLLRAANCRATFFTVGWVAEKFPELIRDVVSEKHEVACHSHLHRQVYRLTRDEFREDTRRAKGAIEDAAGTTVLGYRAPSFSVTGKSLWALEVLAELGFKYDSSIFPVRHLDYGMPDAPRKPFSVKTQFGPITEFPMTTLDFGGRSAPFAGGAYLRLLPYSFTRWGIHQLNECEGRAACVYLHPWELDPDQPRIKASVTSRLRHYMGLKGMQRKLRKLLTDFAFCPLGELLPESDELSTVSVVGEDPAFSLASV
jgi:polysaccharide deacetylase family protein (PEP-CTERM system associated)